MCAVVHTCSYCASLWHCVDNPCLNARCTALDTLSESRIFADEHAFLAAWIACAAWIGKWTSVSFRTFTVMQGFYLIHEPDTDKYGNFKSSLVYRINHGSYIAFLLYSNRSYPLRSRALAITKGRSPSKLSALDRRKSRFHRTVWSKGLVRTFPAAVSDVQRRQPKRCSKKF